MASACLSNCTTATTTTSASLVGAVINDGLAVLENEEFWSSWEEMGLYIGYQPWLFSLIGSVMVGLSGIFPLFVIPIEEAVDFKHGDSSKTLKILLSFAVGGLLGDVFLHTLPEAWANQNAANKAGIQTTMGCGPWVLTGFLVFVIAEMIFAPSEETESQPIESLSKPQQQTDELENNNCLEKAKNGLAKNGFTKQILNVVASSSNGLKKDEVSNGAKKSYANGFKNGYVNGCAKANGVKSNGYCTLMESNDVYDEQLYKTKPSDSRVLDRPKHITGYLNLMANSVDNFTHGLAVGGSFLLSFRMGVLTTFAILIHEIPHEIGDFAILLKSGFSRWDAAKAQLLTAFGGILGAFIAVVFSGDEVESKTNWILPFTAGSFLHIGLVTVLPELLRETDPWESLKQMGALLIGIAIMAFVTIMSE